jgi:hypothetical protein
LAHAQEAAERGDRIDDMAADFLDHETPDRPNSLAGRVVNGRAMYLIVLNERMCRARWLQSIGHACFRRGSLFPIGAGMSCGADIRLDAADPFSIPICRGRVPRIRRDGCIVRVQHHSDCLWVQPLRFRQKPIGLVSVARRLLVQSLFGKRARTIGKFGS